MDERLGWLSLHDRWGVGCYSLCGTTTVSDLAVHNDWGEYRAVDNMKSTGTIRG